MNSKIRRRLHNRRTSGISEVVGAMLLMIVVVVAVGTFAYYLNNLQNSTQNRQNFQNNIANDKLQITQIQFTLNNSQIRYEMVFTSNHTIRFWIQIVSNTTVQLINETTGHLAHLANLNSSSSLTSTPGPFNQAYYNSINFSTSAVLYSLHDSRPLWNISFIPSTASVPGNYTFRTASWSNATVSVRNLNTQPSGIKVIQVNGVYLHNSWFITDSLGVLQSPLYAYNASSSPISIPAKGAVNVRLNLGSLSIPRNESLQIVLLSTIGNYFTAFYSPPFPSIQESVNSQNLLVNTQDVPNFDASKSTAANSTYIQGYTWQLDVPETGWNGAWSNVAHLDTVFAFGQPLQIIPTSFFTKSEVSNLGLQLTGPFRVTLTIVDGNGLMTTSQQVVFPTDANIDPPVSMSTPVVTGGPCASGYTTTVRVLDVFGQPVANIPVSFVQTFGSVTPPSQVISTNATGHAAGSFTCSATAGILIKAGNLPPAAVGPLS